MSSRQRMPGLLQGQVYTYPAKRWRKRRRQYLMNAMQTKSKSNDVENIDTIAVSTVENTLAVSVNEDSKDSIGGNSAKDEPLTKVPVSIWRSLISILLIYEHYEDLSVNSVNFVTG